MTNKLSLLFIDWNKHIVHAVDMEIDSSELTRNPEDFAKIYLAAAFSNFQKVAAYYKTKEKA